MPKPYFYYNDKEFDYICRGGEIECRYNYSITDDLELSTFASSSLNFLYVDSTKTGYFSFKGKRVDKSPYLLLNLGMNLNYNSYYVSAIYHTNREIQDNTGTPTEPENYLYNNFNYIDFKVGKKIDSFDITLGINNLTNETYYENKNEQLKQNYFLNISYTY